MKKVVTFMMLMVGVSGVGLFAQTALPKGQTQVNFGVGFSNRGVPVYLGLDHAVHNNVTLGAEVSYRGYNERFGNDRFKHNVFGILGSVNYHFNTILEIPSNWDFYAGANVGFFSWGSPDGYNGRYNSGLGAGGQIGGRYFFTNKTGVNLEFGGGNAFSGGKFGLTIKL